MTEAVGVSEPLGVDDWIHLNIGDKVSVQRVGESASAGQIEDITADAMIFWVHLDQGRGRIVIHQGDRSVVRRIASAWLQGGN